MHTNHIKVTVYGVVQQLESFLIDMLVDSNLNELKQGPHV